MSMTHAVNFDNFVPQVGSLRCLSNRGRCALFGKWNSMCFRARSEIPGSKASFMFVAKHKGSPWASKPRFSGVVYLVSGVLPSWVGLRPVFYGMVSECECLLSRPSPSPSSFFPLSLISGTVVKLVSRSRG